MDNFQEKYDILVKKYNTLLNENEKLKSILQQHGIAYPTEKINNTETAFSSITFPPVNLSLDDKITLFRSFFKGREDIFARRWFSKTTEKGATSQSVSTNGAVVYVIKTVQMCRMPEQTFRTSDRPRCLSSFRRKR